MELATPQRAREITELMSRVRDVPGIDKDELETSVRLKALPISATFAFYLLRPDGTVVFCESPDAPEFATDVQSLLFALAYAAKRYPSLAQFIPSKPPDAPTCSLCGGTGFWGNLKSGRCANCAGLGWVASGA